MKRARFGGSRWAWGWFAVWALAGFAGGVWGQGGGAGGAGGGKPPAMPTVELEVTAQGLQKPDLAYRLVPGAEDLQKGNAAVKYLGGLTGARDRPAEEAERIDGMARAPLEELDEAAAAKVVADYGTALKFFRAGARREMVDWEPDLRQEGFAALLPSLGPIRQMSNVLRVAIRLDLKQRRWAEAQEKIQTGYALARHLGEGETLIESLVGVAVATQMNKCVEEWVAQPGAPNLYWPLTDLPRPFNDLRRPLAYERVGVLFGLPEMRDMQAGRLTAEGWIRFVNRLSDVTHTIGSATPGGTRVAPAGQQLVGVAAGVLEYPRAKAFLRERGASQAEVEKMPVAEVLGRYCARSFDETADDMFKWLALDYAEGRAGYEQAERAFSRTSPAQVNWLARMLLPALGRSKLMAARLDRQVAMLRIVEGLRAYAAEHGALPERLEQLAVPVPLDPVRGEAFGYERRGAGATLTGVPPGSSGVREGMRYEITVRGR